MIRAQFFTQIRIYGGIMASFNASAVLPRGELLEARHTSPEQGPARGSFKSWHYLFLLWHKGILQNEMQGIFTVFSLTILLSKL